MTELKWKIESNTITVDFNMRLSITEKPDIRHKKTEDLSNTVDQLHLESESESHSVVSDSLWPHGLHGPRNSPGQNTGVGSLSLRQGSSQSRDRTQVSHIAGRFSTVWATREAHTRSYVISFLENTYWVKNSKNQKRYAQIYSSRNY